MRRRKCMECGKTMQFGTCDRIVPFCSKGCSDKHKERQYNSPETCPLMPHLKADNITDEGYIALVKAIVARASHDVTHFKAGTRVRLDAEKFFESDHFNALTGLDGKSILRDLRVQAKDKLAKRGKCEKCEKKPMPGHYQRSVLCVETGVMYSSIKAAAQVVGCWPCDIQRVCSGRQKTTHGFHFKYVEGET